MTILPSLENVPAGGERPADSAGFAQELAGLVLAIQDEHADPGRSLAVVAEAAAKILPDADSAAVVAASRVGHLRLLACCGELAAAVVDLENEIGEGPGLAAGRRLDQILVPDTASERRWPRFGGRAAALGAAGLVGTPLSARADETAAEGLLLVSGTAGAFDGESARLAAAFATHVGIALAATRTRRELGVGLLSRDVIGQAKGILMERHRVTGDEAFALLSRVSQDTNTPLRDVAGELCRTGALAAHGRRGRGR